MKTIALVAHDHKKDELVSWAVAHKSLLADCQLVATGTTGKRLQAALDLPIHRYESGPLGGDQQIGALIPDHKLDVLVFFWDPLNPAPHDPDVKALLRLCSVWNVAVACNQATADLVFSSPLLTDKHYQREIPTY